MSLSVVVVDDHPLILRGIADILSDAPDIAIAATATSAAEAVDAVRRTRPDLVLLDLRLGDVVATAFLPDLQAAAPGAKVVVLSAFAEPELVRVCRARGAASILLKDALDLDLPAVLRAVAAGEIVIDPRLAPKATRRTDASPVHERLSEREHQVLCLLARGLNTREMAAEMKLKPNTVRSYTQTVLAKLQAHNRLAALAAGRRLHLI